MRAQVMLLVLPGYPHTHNGPKFSGVGHVAAEGTPVEVRVFGTQCRQPGLGMPHRWYLGSVYGCSTQTETACRSGTEQSATHRAPPNSETVASVTSDRDDRAHVWGAPGRIRTCAPASGGRVIIFDVRVADLLVRRSTVTALAKLGRVFGAEAVRSWSWAAGGSLRAGSGRGGTSEPGPGCRRPSRLPC